MANYYSFTVTEKTFQVSDITAFRKAFESLYTDMAIHERKDGEIWIDGYNASMVVFDDDDNQIELAEIIQSHIKPDDYAVIQTVGYEKLRYVDGAVYVISKEKVLVETLQSMTNKLLEQIEEDWIKVPE